MIAAVLTGGICKQVLKLFDLKDVMWVRLQLRTRSSAAAVAEFICLSGTAGSRSLPRKHCVCVDGMASLSVRSSPGTQRQDTSLQHARAHSDKLIGHCPSQVSLARGVIKCRNRKLVMTPRRQAPNLELVPEPRMNANRGAGIFAVPSESRLSALVPSNITPDSMKDMLMFFVAVTRYEKREEVVVPRACDS